ncbi:MAG: tRNA 5-hydroxyuridine modification protein YegQ [Gammaproteobacteria bacterium]|nr:tRNA 5-hydroxyuridine modification protein YegQ [Gammaproteobacteria bacterium]
MKTPELLSPAGLIKNMRYAFAYGADAVYAGLPRYSLRVRNNDFRLPNLEAGINEAHELGKKFFVATNILPHTAKIKTFIRDMEPIIALDPDALIMADPGLIMMVREKWPDMPVHLSVQANTLNSPSVKFWQSVGVERIILSRELSLKEIAEIRDDCPDVELEVFVHGSLCIAYSGRCLLSGYFNHRDPNQGTCTNSCRWNYKVKNNDGDQSIENTGVWKPESDVSRSSELELNEVASQQFLLEEENRPGEYMPIEEDEHGTYIMNSRDLRAVEHIHRLVDIGVDCLKIEGRTKSYYYTARATQIYRRAIDDAVNGKKFDPHLMSELENLAHRGYTDGFFERHAPQEMQRYRDSSSRSQRQIFSGEVMEFDNQNNRILVDIKNKITVGDEVELLTSDGNYPFVLQKIVDQRGNDMECAPGSGHQVWIDIEENIKEVNLGLLCRNLDKQTARIDLD